MFPDDGPIRRDIDTLQRAKYSRLACESNGDCPTGSHCDDGTDTCQWSCLADSDCSPGKACDALGVCVARSTFYKSDTLDECLAVPPDVRRTVLLGDGTEGSSLNERQVACDLGTDNDNDDCPCGSYCSLDAECRVECLATDPPEGYECAPGETCSPSGRCQPAGSTSDGPALEVRLEMSPSLVTANTAAAASALIPVTVRISANSLDFLQAAHPAKVRYSVVAIENPDGTPATGPNPVVNCDPDHAGALKDECTLAGGWSFDLTAQTLRSLPRTIWVQIPETSTPRHWLLVARSESAAAPAVVTVDATPLVVPASDPGRYTGTVSFANAGGPASANLSLPIEAIVTAGHVALFEPTRVMFPDGHVVLSRDAAKTTMLGWLGSSVSGPANRYDVRLDLGALAYDTGHGHLAGEIGLHLGADLAGTTLVLALDRTGDADAPVCPLAGSCATGSYCEPAMNLCLPGAGPATGAGIVLKTSPAATPSKTLASAQRADWDPTLTRLVGDHASLLGGTGLSGMAQAYCYQPGESVPAKFGVTTKAQEPSQNFTCTLGSVLGADEFNQRTFAFENRITEVQFSADRAQSFNLLDECLDDLAVPSPRDAATRSDTLDPKRSCASLAQFYLALNANVRPGASPTLEIPQVKMVTHLLRQWLGVNAYVANSVVQNRQFDDVVGRSTSTAEVRLGSAVDIVDTGLRVLLDPTVRPQFTADAAAPSVTVAPDYRIPTHSVSRWTFNNIANASAPGADGPVAFNVTSVDTSSQGILTLGGAATCQSTSAVTIEDRRFSIVFYLANLINGSTVTVFEKVGSDGQRIWVEATPGAPGSGKLNLVLKDSNGGVATFPSISSSPSAAWGLLGFVADGATYRLYVAPPQALGSVQVLPANTVQNGGPRWGTPGPVRLGCSIPRTCQQHTSCTSWDRTVPGDGQDVGFSSSTMIEWVRTQICQKTSTRTTCSGPSSTQAVAQCNDSAISRRQQLISQLFPNPPAGVANALAVTGTVTKTQENEPDGNMIVTTTTYECNLAIANLPAPVTAVKPVCDCSTASPAWAPQGVFYDELSLWSRPLDPDEFATMASTYRFTSANESIPSKTYPGKEQATGLAAHLVEAAAADLHLLASYVNAARSASYGECYLGAASPSREIARDRAGRNLRLVAAIEAEAASLASSPGASSAPWYARYQADRTVLAANRAKVLQELQLLSECRNPLNIAEEVLPLFVGQAVGAADRFFASTHFLTTLAQSHIVAATTALGAAQNAYNAQVTADFTKDLSVDDKAQTLERLKVTYDGVLRRYCGAPAGGTRLVDSFRNGTLDAGNCFLKSERPECQNLTDTPLEAIPSSCLRGEIGEQLIAIQSASVDAANAQNALSRSIEQYHVNTLYCAERQKMLQSNVSLLSAHQRTMQKLRRQQSTDNNFINFIGFMANGLAENTQGAIGSWIKLISDAENNSEDQQRTQEAYEFELAQRSANIDVRECFHRADNDKFAIDAAHDVITRAAVQTKASLLGLVDAKNTLTALATEADGQILLQAAVDRTPPHLHYWLDNHIDTYHREMSFARRLTYLAVRAFEYEGQQSTNLRHDVLTARHPGDLDAVADLLAGQAAPVSGGPFHFGQEPVVLGLRDEILRVEDLTGNLHLPPGQLQVSATTVFRRFLTSDSSRIYGEAGTLLGRGVRFSIQPAFWNNLLCAERTIRVTPMVSFDGPRPAHPDLLLIQDNAFGSQVCGAEPGKVEITRVGARSNLVTDDTSTNFQAPSPSSAMIINLAPATVTSRDELEALPFGESSDFAGRGLYGNYILVFPHAPPCSVDASGAPTACAGWSADKLAQVKDVLLRFEIVEGTQQLQ